MDLVLTHPRLRVVRYLGAFGLWLALMAVVFSLTRPYWVTLFMYPLAGGARVVLSALGLPATLGEPFVSEGICLLGVEDIVYRVTFECTGLFALFICCAAVLAFPATTKMRLRGLMMVVPAFVTYALLRLVVLGLVAHLSPAYINLFHLYVMVVANVGFVLGLWLIWLQEARQEVDG